MLEVRELKVSYGPVEAVRDVTVTARAGVITAVLGANGAGKSSLLKAISGLEPAQSGKVFMDGIDITSIPTYKRARMGIAYALEGRRLFHNLTVEENLKVAWEFRPGEESFEDASRRVYGNFQILGDRRNSPSRTMSGGQQQMLILSCAMIRCPKYLLLDEPSLGLAPIIVRQIFQFIGSVCRERGTTVLLVEQMASLALQVADYGYVLRRGKVVLKGTGKDLLGMDLGRVLSSAYLGGDSVERR
ncbi:MAG: ABC transporter ATP-binding protein [Desulfobacteria bacterium]